MKAKQVSQSNKNLRLLFSGLLSLTFLFLLTACGKSSTPALTTTPTSTTSATAAAWTADGIITPGEYPNSANYSNGRFEVDWKTDAQYIYISIKAQTSGWVAIGFNATSQMKDIDFVFGRVSNGKAYVYDEYSGDFHGQHQQDESLGGTEDITVYGGQEQNGYTIFEFKRALVTGDKYDASLSAGDVSIIWAYGSSDDISAEHSARGSGHLII